MEKLSQHPPQDEIIASLRSCAESVARTSDALAARVVAEKFSFESEFSMAFRESVLEKLTIPAPVPGHETSVPAPGYLRRILAERFPPPCAIPSVCEGETKRPLWTVAIPACDPDPEYFSVLLASVVKALSRTASWEIVIVDGSAQKGAAASVAGRFSKHAIRVIMLPSGSGPIAAGNECLRRSRGEFVHILQQDDLVSELFYSELGESLKSHPEVGLAACHNGYFDFREQARFCRPVQENSGCYGDLKFAVMWAYRLPSSALVVRRSLYEALGGFHEDLGLWAEWEMRARLLAASPLWFHRDAMVLARLHSASRRQKEMRSARGLEACPKAISLAASCYPESIAKDFEGTSSYLFAREFAHFGCCLFTANCLREGMMHFEAAIGLSPHPNISEIVKRRSFHLLKSQTEEEICKPSRERPSPAPTERDFFPADELQELEAIVAAYRADPADRTTLEQARALRNGLCAHLLDADPAGLENLFCGNFGGMFSLLRACGIAGEEPGDEERGLAGRTLEMSADPGGILAAALLSPAHRSALPIGFAGKPDWLLPIYLDHLLAGPEGFGQPGEADLYFDHVTAVLAAIEREIAISPIAPAAKWSAFQIAQRLNLIPVYFSQRDMKELMCARARILGFLLRQNGSRLEAGFPPRPFNRKKIRAGFLSAHLGPQTETYTSAPSFYLDREKFDIRLFVLGSNPSAIEDHCRSVSDSFTVLPPSLAARVETLRAADLDVLVIGTNMTAVTNDILLLGMHRLAPIQIASSSSPMTPGLPHLDGFLSGVIHGYDAYTGQFNERLLLIDGAISCLEYSADRPQAEKTFTRTDFGIPAGVPLFVSGANFFKILPELQATWAEILKRVPGSYLLLHPFNPNWTNSYPVARFRRDIRGTFERAGVDPDRIVISEEKLPTRADVSRMMALGDVYLDSYPFSGSVSLVDPLEAGVPPVAWRATSLRGHMAASMLSDLDLRELVAETAEEFIATAVRLATDPKERGRISAKIRSAMAAGPRFFDVQKYGREVSRALEEIVLAERVTEEAPSNKEIVLRAELALDSGRPGEAEDLCRHVLEREPETAACWALLAELARRSGNSDYAAELAGQALQLEPGRADFWCALGEIRRENKDPDGALDAFRRALELQPAFPNAWLGMAIVHDERGEAPLAEQSYSKALLHSKDRVETARIRINIAGFLREQKRMKEAIKHLRKAVSAAPDSCETLLLLGSFLQEGGDLLDAMSTFSRVAKKFPGNAKSWLEWGKTLLLLGKRVEAVEKMRKAVACQPDDPDVLFNLGYALQQNLQRTESLQVYLDAERAGCDTGDLHTNIGVILKDQERYMEAAQRFHKGFERNPQSHAAMNNLGAVCINLGLTTEAIECFQHALRLNPTMSAPHSNLGHMLKISGRAEEGMDYYLKGLKLDPENKEMMHNYLLSTLYQVKFSPQEICEEHRKWGGRLAAGVKSLPRRHVRDGHPQGKIRIGYVSPDLCLHPVSFFAAPLMGGHDRERFEVYVYADVRKEDAVTARFRNSVDVWRDITELKNPEAGELMGKDEVDILVDLCGHTAHNRLEVLAARPAPIIASYLGYPATTGMPGVDFRITDALADPRGRTDAWHTEKLVRLDRCAWCFEPPANTPTVGPLPLDTNGFLTFGCFNNLAKLNAPLYDVWAEILRQVPDSRLFLKAKTLIDPGICQEVRDYFTSRGIPQDRLRVSGFEASSAGHFDRYNEVDIALDSYPYHGTTTTCEALWMGVPVITRAGEAHLSRVGVSLLHAVGHPGLAASSEKEYIRLAVELARDSVRLRALRAGLRGQMQASPLLDQAGFIQALEAALLSLLPADLPP